MKKLVVLSLGLALAACGSQTDTSADGTEVSIDGPAGKITVNTDVDLPDGYDVYPGANVTTNSKLTTANGVNLNVVLETADPADQVVAYYRKQAEAAGVTIQSEIKSGTTQVITGKDKAGTVFSLNVFPDDSGKTIATLTLAEDRGV